MHVRTTATRDHRIRVAVVTDPQTGTTAAKGARLMPAHLGHAGAVAAAYPGHMVTVCAIGARGGSFLLTPADDPSDPMPPPTPTHAARKAPALPSPAQVAARRARFAEKVKGLPRIPSSSPAGRALLAYRSQTVAA